MTHHSQEHLTLIDALRQAAEQLPALTARRVVEWKLFARLATEFAKRLEADVHMEEATASAICRLLLDAVQSAEANVEAAKDATAFMRMLFDKLEAPEDNEGEEWKGT